MQSRVMLSSDLHLGHDSVIKFRGGFSTPEEHHETVFENLATNINKRDSLILLGDVAFNKEWLARIATINCKKKTLILGNHDTDRKVHIRDLVGVFDDIHSLHKRKKMLLSHCPIHPDEFRGNFGCIHGHKHDGAINDPRYFNICVEHTEYKPVSLDRAISEITGNLIEDILQREGVSGLISCRSR